MKISAIQTTVTSVHNSNTKFKGVVNGRYYADNIIEAAKKAIDNPNWEKEMLAKKSTFLKDYTTAHEDLSTRILAGIVSFGCSELVIAGISALGSLSDDTDEKIAKIKDCMIDLLKSK